MRFKLNKSSKLMMTAGVILILILALTTATFAWFSSNRSVSAGTTEFEAYHEGSGANIRLYWGNTFSGSGMTVQMEPLKDMMPMCPESQPIVGSTESANIKFWTVNQLGEFFGSARSLVQPSNLKGYTATDPQVLENFLTIENAGDTDITSGLNIEAIFDEDVDTYKNNDILRIAMYQKLSTSTKYIYAGTLCSGANTTTHYGVIPKEGTPVRDYNTTYNATKTVSFLDQNPSNTIFLGAHQKLNVILVAWYDGQLLTSATAGEKAKVNFKVSVV